MSDIGEKVMICDRCGKPESDHNYRHPFKLKSEQPTQEQCGCDLEVNYLCKKHGEEKQAYSAVQPTQSLPGVEDYIREHGMPPYEPTQLPKRPHAYPDENLMAYADSLEKELKVMRSALVNACAGHPTSIKYWIEAARKESNDGE